MAGWAGRLLYKGCQSHVACSEGRRVETAVDAARKDTWRFDAWCDAMASDADLHGVIDSFASDRTMCSLASVYGL